MEEPTTKERLRVVPGELRRRDVKVGRHLAVSPGAFMERLVQPDRCAPASCYGRKRKSGSVNCRAVTPTPLWAPANAKHAALFRHSWKRVCWLRRASAHRCGSRFPQRWLSVGCRDCFPKRRINVLRWLTALLTARLNPENSDLPNDHRTAPAREVAAYRRRGSTRTGRLSGDACRTPSWRSTGGFRPTKIAHVSY